MRARVVLVYLAALVPALTIAVVQPVWSRVDEAQHADVLAQYAHGEFPIEGVTRLQPEIVAVDEGTRVYRWCLPGSCPPPAETDPQAFVAPPPDASAVAKRAWTARHLWGFSYEAMQPPLYYMLAEPDWLLGARYGGTLGAIYAARIFSALIAACLAPLVYLLALAIRPTAQRIPLFAAAMASLMPGYVLNTTQITNDGLAAVLGAGLTLVAVIGVRDGWTRRLAATCGLLLGAAALTKLTAVGLVPLAAAAFMWPGSQPLRSRVAYGTIAGAVAAVIVTPWLLFNLHAYGQAVPSRATLALLGAAFAPAPHTFGYLVASARNAFDEFVAGEPFAIIPYTRFVIWFAEALVVLALIGLWLRRRRLRLEWLLVLGASGDFLWVLLTPYLSGVGGLMPGRYVYPSAAAVLLLLATGIDALPPLLARWAAAAGCAGAALALVMLVSGQFGMVVHHEAVPRPAAGVAVDAHGDAAGLDVTVDRLATGDAGRTVWVHVTVRNTAQRPADFPPIPFAATASGEVLHGDYSGSTPFPERLEAGESVTGWLHFVRGGTSPLTHIDLMYTPITTDGYASLQTLSLVVNP